MTVSLADQIAEVKRELRVRESVYARWALERPSRKADLDRQTERMKAVLATLEGLRTQREPEMPL